MNIRLISSNIMLTLLLLAVSHAAFGHDIDTGDLFSSVIEKSKPAVVFIQVRKTLEKEDPYKDDPALSQFFGTDKENGAPFFSDKISINFGSGFLFRADGYILTNSHVVSDAKEIQITLQDKRVFKAVLIGADPKTDIGVIKIDANQLPTIPLGDSDRIKAGQWVLAIGSPFQYIQSVTAGIISATGRSALGISDYESFIQTDAAINPGNSGGPLLNTNSEAIGINTAFQTQTGGYIGIGFAIPINMARYVSEQLITEGKVTRGWLGVALLDGSEKQLGGQGLPSTATAAYIKEVKPDSPARRAGLQAEDLITAINGLAIAGAADVRNRISLTTPGSEVTLQIYRNGKPEEFKVRLTELQ